MRLPGLKLHLRIWFDAPNQSHWQLPKLWVLATASNRKMLLLLPIWDERPSLTCSPPARLVKHLLELEVHNWMSKLSFNFKSRPARDYKQILKILNVFLKT